MNSLEFINEKIKMIQVGIDSAVKIIKEFDGIAPVDSYKKLVEEHLEEIQILEQIKAELEAWYEIKDLYKKGYFSRIALPMESQEKFKKALEVEDE